jgi:hypothetical protein
MVEECQEEHTPTTCSLFKAKRPEDRLAAVWRKELCTFCFCHLDTKHCWFLGKMSVCRVKGYGFAHSPLLHDVLQNEEVMVLSASFRKEEEKKTELRC